MNLARRILILIASVVPLAAHAACGATNGDAIPSQVYDASAIDARGNPDDPDDPEEDASTTLDSGRDGSIKDAKADSPIVLDAPVQINELYVDNLGLGDAAEFIELRAVPGTPADDLKIRILYANGQVKYEVTVGPAGAKFSAAGLWTVGGAQTFKLNVQENVDQTVNLNAWGLDNVRGAVQLLRGATLLDVVGYGTDPDAGTLPAPASPPLATGEGPSALVPSSAGGGGKGIGFGRRAGALDTGKNATDFCKMEASPGYAQKPCL